MRANLAWPIWVLGILIVWCTASSAIIPSPAAVLAAFPRLWSEGLAYEMITSMFLSFQACVGITLVSLLVAYSARVALLRPLSVIFSAGRFNSFVGLPLILTLIIGDAHLIKLALLIIAGSVFTVPAVVDIIANIPKEKFDDARVLRMSEWRVTWEVVVLGRIDEVIDVLRTNFAMIYMLIPTVEGMFRSEGGVGVLILLENKYLHLDAVYCIVFVIMALGLAQDWVIGMAKQKLCPYAALEGCK